MAVSWHVPPLLLAGQLFLAAAIREQHDVEEQDIYPPGNGYGNVYQQQGYYPQQGYNPQPGYNKYPPPTNQFGSWRPPPWMSNQLHLQLGPHNGYLVPALVPQIGEHLVLMNRESARFIETNEYMWFAYNQPIMKLRGKWQSNVFGHQSVHVEDLSGREVFKIRRTKHVMNPLTWRYSYRILPPHSKNNDEALFTINKDNIGGGFMFLKEEWWIWRGKESFNDLAYYCRGSYLGWDYKFYRDKHAYKSGAQPLAWIEKQANAGAVLGRMMEFLPENYMVHVTPLQDTALIMAVSTVMDMVHDQQQREQNRNSFFQQNQTTSDEESEGPALEKN